MVVAELVSGSDGVVVLGCDDSLLVELGADVVVDGGAEGSDDSDDSTVLVTVVSGDVSTSCAIAGAATTVRIRALASTAPARQRNGFLKISSQ